MTGKRLTALLIALSMLFTLTACGGDGASDDPNLGVWNAKNGQMMGLTMDISEFFGEGFAIELKSRGKCTLTVDGEKSSGTWSLESGKFTVSGGGFDGNGTLENGSLVLEDVLGMGLTLIFEKEGGAPAGSSGSATSGPDYFVITSVTESGTTMSGDDLALLGLDGAYVLLHEDGKADLMFGALLTGTWKDGKIDFGEAGAYGYEISGDELTLDMEETIIVYARSSDTPPAAPEDTGGNAPDAPGKKEPTDTFDIAGWWSGDWYGYWEVYGATEEWSDLEGIRWDCYAEIEMDEDGYGNIFVWDDDVELLFTYLEIEEEYAMDVMGTAYSTEGYFWDDEIGYAEWVLDPGIFWYDDYFVISSYYEDPQPYSTPQGFYYTIVLRPWGILWDDMPEDERPPDYDWWYLENYTFSMPAPGT